MLEELRQLRQDVGGPSLEKLTQHAERNGHDVTRTTFSNLLNGKGKPRRTTVDAFVAACASYARSRRPPIEIPPHAVDPRAWQARYGQAYPKLSIPDETASGSQPATPRQLPPTLRRLAGRLLELETLDGLLKQSASGHGGTVTIGAIMGTAGVGKTALAIWWAHRVSEKFPDGQLYLDLRGFQPGALATTPTEAVRALLGAFGTRPNRIPAGFDSQVALYRSLVAGRRLLMVLDNASDAEQVRQLLPGSPGCMVLVTSRGDLTSLVAIEGAEPLTLDLLSPGEADQMLTQRLGIGRVAAEPDAVEQIIAGCARLPLALAVVAARAAAHATFPLTAYAKQLRETPGRLDGLTIAGTGVDVRAAFSCSYRALDANTARLFRLTALHPGPDISINAAASLAGVPVSQAIAMLTELTRTHLLSEHAPERYTSHDLLRAYALELALSGDDEIHRQLAVRRMLDHYLHTAHAADLLIDPQRDNRTRLIDSLPESVLTPLEDQSQAIDWFRTEHAALVASVQQAARDGFDSYAWQMAWVLTTYLDRLGHWQDWAATTLTGLHAAQRLADPAAQAIMHRLLAHAFVQLDRLADAQVHLTQALDLFTSLGDTASQAATHNSLGGVHDMLGQHHAALHHARLAHDLFDAAGDQIGKAHALNSLGWCYAQLRNYEGARSSCEQSLTLLQDIGDYHGEAVAADSLGYIHYMLRQYHLAKDFYYHSISLFRNVGDRYYEASAYDHLGDCLQDLNDTDGSRQAWETALTIFEELGRVS